jgi:hypothetical protein
MHMHTSCKWLDQDGEEHNCCKGRETHKGDTIDWSKIIKECHCPKCLTNAGILEMPI